MNPKELMLGNYVRFSIYTAPVTAINPPILYLGRPIGEAGTRIERVGTVEDKLVRPVPITPRILVYFGFETKENIIHRKWNMEAQLSNTKEETMWSISLDGKVICYIGYLHELQNLFYLLYKKPLKNESK